MSNARTFGSPGTSPVKCPLCNGTGSEGGGVGGRVIRCRGCNGEKMVSPEKAYQIENGFNLSRMSAPGTSPGAVHSPGLIKSEPVEMDAASDLRSAVKRDPALEQAAQRDYAKAQRAIEKDREELRKVDAWASSYLRVNGKPSAEMQSKYDEINGRIRANQKIIDDIEEAGREYRRLKMSAHTFAIGFLIDGEGPPASLADMERDNAGDTALIARLRSMKPGDVYRAGGGAAAGIEIKAVQMSATPSAHALARAIHEARKGSK